MARFGRAFPIQARIGAPVLAPIQIVGAQSTGVGAPTAGTTGVTVTKPTGLADGDVMFAFVSRTDFANTAAWTCSGWTDIGPAAASAGSATGNDTQTTILRKVVTNAAGEPANYTFVNTNATTYQSIGIIVALRGVDPTTPEDIAVPAYGFTADTINPATLNATSASNNAFVIAYMQQSLAAAASGTGGAPSGYSLVPGGNTFATAGGALDNKAYTAYKSLGTAGAATGTAVWTNATDPGTAESLTAVVLVRPMSVAAPVTGTVAVTLGDVTSAAAGGPLVTGTLTETLDNLTSAAAGASGASGSLAETLDNATAVAAGASGASGSLAETLDNVTSAAAGSSVSGTTAITLANVTSAASGTFTAPSVTGTVAVTLANTTSAAAGSSTAGTVARTLANVTSTASGTFTPDTVTGTVARTLANTTSAASGSSVAGTTARTLANTTLAASGASGASGSVAETLDNTTLAASGTAIVPVTGTLAATLANTTSAASGTAAAPVTGTLTVTLGNVTSAANGTFTPLVSPDPHPAKCTIRRQRFTRRLRYHRYAERPAVTAWALNIFNELIDFSDPEYTFTFRIGSVDTVPVLEKQTNIFGAAGTGTEHDGTPNITILWAPGELDIEPGMYQCQLIGTLSDLDEVFHGIIHISDAVS